MGKFLTGSPTLDRVIPGDPDYERAAATKRFWRVGREIRYRSDDVLKGEVVVVPTHRGGETYLTDLASVPWLFRRWFPQDGPWTGAAIVHDWFCDVRPSDVSARTAADIFLEAMKDLQVPSHQRVVMHRGVVHFGPKWGVATGWEVDPPKGGTQLPPKPSRDRENKNNGH